MLIGVPAETMAGETRVAATPETVKKLRAQGHVLRVQSGAGVAASVPDALFEAAGAEIVDAAGALGADLVLKVRIPSEDELPLVRKGATLVGMLDPFQVRGIIAGFWYQTKYDFLTLMAGGAKGVADAWRTSIVTALEDKAKKEGEE